MQNEGNTVGSRLKNIPTEIAYIAGFLDGDGSVMFQLKRRSDTRFGFRCMTTICFYQQTAHARELKWIQDVLCCGFISHRNDNMTELRITSLSQCERILSLLKPYVRFKRIQVDAVLTAIKLLQGHPFPKLSKESKQKLIEIILLIQQQNYHSMGKRTKSQLEQLFNLTP